DLTTAYVRLLGSDRLDALPGLRDLAYTAGAGRSHLDYRLAVVGDGRDSLRASLESAMGRVALIPGAPHDRTLVFVLSGYGAQWPGMGRELVRRERVFAEAIAACERALAPYSDGWTLSEVLHAAEDDPRLRRGSVM